MSSKDQLYPCLRKVELDSPGPKLTQPIKTHAGPRRCSRITYGSVSVPEGFLAGSSSVHVSVLKTQVKDELDKHRDGVQSVHATCLSLYQSRTFQAATADWQGEADALSFVLFGKKKQKAKKTPGI